MVLVKFLTLFALIYLTTAFNPSFPDFNKYPANRTDGSFLEVKTFEVDVLLVPNEKTFTFADGFTTNHSVYILYTLPIGIRNKTFVTLKYGTDRPNVTVEFKVNITNDVPNPRDLEGLYIVYLIDQNSHEKLTQAIQFIVTLKSKLLLRKSKRCFYWLFCFLIDLKTKESDCSKNSECESNFCIEDDKKVKKCKCDFGRFYKKENTTEKCIKCKFMFRFVDNLMNFLKCF